MPRLIQVLLQRHNLNSWGEIAKQAASNLQAIQELSAMQSEPENTVQVVVELTDEEADALADFLKRVCFSEYQLRCLDDQQAYLAQDAGKKIRMALIEKGYDPR